MAKREGDLLERSLEAVAVRDQEAAQRSDDQGAPTTIARRRRCERRRFVVGAVRRLLERLPLRLERDRAERNEAPGLIPRFRS